ncbi:MAG: type II toxin-antitoxin system Phd/YefM family antitoxin [Armatimonadetes bacterium]|nr:type II toxin-antitoxin system Phd/YefM family antitoxin [Armatimonadota bacterium]
MAGRIIRDIVYRDGCAVAVILGIEEYREMLERLEDLEDLAMLEQMRARGLKARPLEEFLEEHAPSA